MKWREKQARWSRLNYVGQKKKIKMTLDKSEKGWYFYGGGYNSLWDNQTFDTLEEVQFAAEKWMDDNHQTARID